MEDVLARAGEARFAKHKLPISVREWRLAVGARIADRTRPVSLEKGVLVVRVATSAWANELQMLAPELVARLRIRGYAIDNLRFRVGSLDIIEKPPERRIARKVPPPVPLGPELAKDVAGVPDDELRDIIGAAARANLAWQSYLGAELPKTPAAPARAPTGREPSTGGPPSARGPRGAGTGTVPPDRNGGGSGGASRRSSGGDSGRRR